MGYTQHACRALWKWAGRGAGRLSYPQVLLPPGDTPLGVMLPALSTRAHQRDSLFNRPAVERRRHRIMGIHRAQAPAHDVEPALVIHLKVIRALLLALEKEQVGVSALEPPPSISTWAELPCTSIPSTRSRRNRSPVAMLLRPCTTLNSTSFFMPSQHAADHHLQGGTLLAVVQEKACAVPPLVRMPLVAVVLVPHRHRAMGCAARPSHFGRASPRNILL